MTKKTFTVWLIIAIIAQFVFSGRVTAALTASFAEMIEDMFSGENSGGIINEQVTDGPGFWFPTTNQGYGTVWNGEMKDSFSGGTGQIHDPYLITYPHELAFLAYAVNNGWYEYNNEDVHYSLCNDIDLNGIPWTPIGLGEGFCANFHGQNYEISGLFIDTGKIDSTFFGLFGVNLGRIEYLYLSNVRVESQLSYAEIGALCGSSCGIILDCHAEDVSIVFSGVPTSNSSISAYGGLIGATAHINSLAGTIERCSVSESCLMVDVGYVGGLIGYCETPVLECFTDGVRINAYRDAVAVGGLVGELREITRATDTYGETSKIERCYAKVQINSSATCVGGLLGRLTDSKVVDSYARGEASVNGSRSFGGFVGSVFGGKIGSCYCAFDAEAFEVSSTGGFVGLLTNSWEANGWIELTYCVTYTMPRMFQVHSDATVGLFGCNENLFGGNIHDTYYLDENISALDNIMYYEYIAMGESVSRSFLEKASFYDKMYWDDYIWDFNRVNIDSYEYPILKCFE